MINVDIDFDEFLEQAFSKDGDERDLQKINSIAGLFLRIPDTTVDEMTTEQRRIVYALALDVVAGLIFHAREGLRRHQEATEEARNEEGQEPRDSCP